MATDLAAAQLSDGTASSQVIVHYLKLATAREGLERRKLIQEVSLMETKQALMESERRVENLIADALTAMRAYSGHAPEDEESDYDEFED